jgi:hypothetical protein
MTAAPIVCAEPAAHTLAVGLPAVKQLPITAPSFGGHAEVGGLPFWARGITPVANIVPTTKSTATPIPPMNHSLRDDGEYLRSGCAEPPTAEVGRPPPVSDEIPSEPCDVAINVLEWL